MALKGCTSSEGRDRIWRAEVESRNGDHHLVLQQLYNVDGLVFALIALVTLPLACSQRRSGGRVQTSPHLRSAG
jgi:hypothetical protein